MKLLAFAASTSSTSINHELVSWAASQFEGYEVEVLRLSDYDMPMYSSDEESDNGVPQNTIELANKIGESDLVLISFAEHNGAYTAAFKNAFDWLSRVPNQSAFQEKAMFLMATSRGKRGASTVLEIATNRFPFNGGDVKGSYSLAEYALNFDVNKGIHNTEELNKFNHIKTRLLKALEN